MSDLITEAQEAMLCEECEERPAQHHCLTCVGHLCGQCKDAHERRKITSGHKIVPLSADIPVYGNCFDHPRCKYEVFCSKCDVPICMECMMKTHNGHKIEDIQEAFVRKKNFVIETISKIGNILIPEKKKQLEIKRSEVKEMKKATTKMREIMKHQSEKLIAHIKNMLKSNLEEVDKIESSQVEDLISQEKHLDEMIAELNSQKDDLENKLANRVVTDLLLLVRDDFNIQTGKISDKKYTLPQFIPGSVEKITISIHFGIIISPSTSNLEGLLRDDFFMINSKDMHSNKQYGIQCLDDSSAWVRNEEITLKMLQMTGNKTNHQIICSQRPSGVCVDGNSVLYSDFENKQLTRVINMEWGPKGICVSKSGDILTCLCDYSGKENRGKVVKMSKTGELIMEITNNDVELKTVAYITENKNLDICVSDTEQKKVFIFSVQGNLRCSYDGKLGSYLSEFDPTELDVDSLGNIVVGDEANNCVHIISRDGSFVAYLGTKFLTLPRGVSVDSENRIWVAEKKSGCIKVFEYLK